MTAPTTVVPKSPLRHLIAEGSGLTHRGCVRSRNEDAILTDPTGKLWAVADGMGGYGQGDVAADIVIDHLELIPDSDGAASLVARLTAANAAVRKRAIASGAGQIGATAVAMMIQDALAHVAWVGDCRAYLYRHGHLRMLTRDHTVVQTLIDLGQLTADAALTHPEKHVVTRAVGGADEIEVDLVSLPVFAGDRLLICSDGLAACVGAPQLTQALAAAPTPYEACLSLLRGALDNGAPDNVSVIVVDMAEG